MQFINIEEDIQGLDLMIAIVIEEKEADHLIEDIVQDIIEAFRLFNLDGND